ncbi:Rha family transcriptional regulator [Aggregatibacter actinomycetemcomitans]|uniref:Rha family transcriptional regulator n=1 Tax=Aggregatibacter actinomycetemcomitans TaxID=714 RepID=UPI00197B9259|nr:Rha family transcriptional regulator [Aggregatibacter actinomycetemcomitans]MBN6075332.1 Rha family transcriptional regulator [Aggregatibacter actinomycetemcomitans]
MKTLTKLNATAVFPKVFHRETVAMTDTRKVSQFFGKQHKNVLRIIENLGCSGEFWRLNFKPSKYKDERGKMQPIYLMTQDGFTLLTMGFTGKKAMQFKEAYIAEFNTMKNWIIAKGKLTSDQHRMNEAIKFIQDTTGRKDEHAYSRENNLVYVVALGKSRKKWLIDNGYSTSEEIRHCLSEAQLQLVDDLLSENAVMIKLGMDYYTRKTKLEQSALYFLRKQLPKAA